MTTFLNGLWQGALIAAAVWLVLGLTPRLNAATRYVIWWATLLVVSLLPLRTLWTGFPGETAGSAGASRDKSCGGSAAANAFRPDDFRANCQSRAGFDGWQSHRRLGRFMALAPDHVGRPAGVDDGRRRLDSGVDGADDSIDQRLPVNAADQAWRG